MAIVGFVVVLVAVFGGFAMAGGPFAVMMAWSEWVVICGTGLGTVLVSTPPSVLKALLIKIPKTFKGGGSQRAFYVDVLKLLFELFQTARRDGLIAIESHIERPDESSILKKYPDFLSHHHAVEFLCDALRTVLVGSVPPFDLESMLEMEIEVHHDADEKTVAALQRVADALPAIGIVAAVLGIVVTMQSLGGPIEQIGHHVASALVGTFLGILLSYGFVAPLASNMEGRNAEEARLYFVLKAAIVALAKNLPPMVAVEFARKAITAEDRPSFVDMETAVKTTKLEKAA
ncbi:MAG TPA: flagellar motor stator protein MotA [Gemmatimonadales bacterium]|jgi:chemotaxis protein MotA|nr:flagellar motor stator protein MotA [Gemmatimonadales bacterium]